MGCKLTGKPAQAQENAEFSDTDFEDDGHEDDEGDDEPVDIRSLVQAGKDRGTTDLNDGPAKKKQRKSR